MKGNDLLPHQFCPFASAPLPPPPHTHTYRHMYTHSGGSKVHYLVPSALLAGPAVEEQHTCKWTSTIIFYLLLIRISVTGRNGSSSRILRTSLEHQVKLTGEYGIPKDFGIPQGFWHPTGILASPRNFGIPWKHGANGTKSLHAHYTQLHSSSLATKTLDCLKNI